MGRNPSQGAKKKPKKRGSPQVERIFVTGRKAANDFLAVYWLKTSGTSQNFRKKNLFLVVGKAAIPLAHERNRAKRLIREIYRKWDAPEKQEIQTIVRVRQYPQRLTLAPFKECLEPLLEKMVS